MCIHEKGCFRQLEIKPGIFSSFDFPATRRNFLFFPPLHFLYFSCKIRGGSDIPSAVKVWLWFYILHFNNLSYFTLQGVYSSPPPVNLSSPKRQKVETSASPPSLHLLCWKYCSHSTERFALSSFVNTHYHKKETLSLALECHVWIFSQYSCYKAEIHHLVWFSVSLTVVKEVWSFALPPP